MDSLVVDTALGIIFIFGTFALLISVVTELIARFIGLRGEYLLRGIRSLVDEKNEFKLPVPVILRLRKPAVPGREPTSNTAKILTTSYVANTGGSGALPAKQSCPTRIAVRSRPTCPAVPSRAPWWI
ncbi:hypothetical protein [Nakamurella sp. PAMC28650]|uniref:hypothetical protein n=1 Tax=Nakamurella sp. PAMC28650 TaxID=2762325 RepID=UPI00164E0ADA|nr:hypothetical protein [Nakamurella sp. PAMC28650]QNK80376.1 hypothetical protein H7F38_19600 [Nakamurella sp. PAMC28650]